MPRGSFLNTLWRTNKVLPLIVGALLLLNLGSAVVAYWVVAPNLADLETNFLQQQERFRDARKSGEADNSPQGIFRQGLKDLQTLVASIPETGEFTGLVEDVFSMAGQAGLDIDRVNYDPTPVKGEDLISYSLSFTVTGRYGQVKKFIYLIEHSPRLVAIEALTLTSRQEHGPGEIALGLKLTTYFRTPAP